jgi:hypothetical protein
MDFLPLLLAKACAVKVIWAAADVRFGSLADIFRMSSRCSLFPPKADIGTQPLNVRFVPKADIP